jgi:hypothetical protein
MDCPKTAIIQRSLHFYLSHVQKKLGGDWVKNGCFCDTPVKSASLPQADFTDQSSPRKRLRCDKFTRIFNLTSIPLK